MSQEPLVEAYRAAHGFQAHMVANFLQEAGIPAVVDGDSLGWVVGDVPAGWTTSPRVMVPGGELEHARLLISTAENLDDGPLISEAEWDVVPSDDVDSQHNSKAE